VLVDCGIKTESNGLVGSEAIISTDDIFDLMKNVD